MEAEEEEEWVGTGHPAGCRSNGRSAIPITSAASAILTASILYARSTSISDHQVQSGAIRGAILTASVLYARSPSISDHQVQSGAIRGHSVDQAWPIMANQGGHSGALTPANAQG